MQNAKFKHYLHLHFLVLIAGFTAILGELISIGAFELVWYRMSIAGILMLLFIKLVKLDLRVSKRTFLQFAVAGLIVALHWVTFFESINQANVSIALSMFSSGAFFASFIEPIFFKRKVLGYEIAFGVVVIIGVVLITQSEIKYINGILLGLASALFSTLFAVVNGRFIERYNATIISFYEFLSGVICLTIFIVLFTDGFSMSFFKLSNEDWIYILILASVCTAYAFIGAIEVMKHITPFTVILSYNLEPVYGIGLALLLFPEKEQMSTQFYIGAVLIIVTIVVDAIVKNYKPRHHKSNAKPN